MVQILLEIEESMARALEDVAPAKSRQRVEEVKAALGHALGWPELTIVD